MVTANELRVGNFIQRNGNTVKVGWGTLQAISQGADVGEGILITSYIINRTASVLGRYEWLIDDEIFEMKNGLLYYTAGEGVCLGVGCKYLHQLQNLYFALTLKEMTVNL